MFQYNWISIKQSCIKGTTSLKAASDQSPKVMVGKNGKLENERTPKWQFSSFPANGWIVEGQERCVRTFNTTSLSKKYFSEVFGTYHP